MLVGNVPEHWLRAIAGCVSQRRYPSGLGLTTSHRAHMLIIFCTLDALSPAMQSRHNCETNDWDCGSSNSDTESGSDNGLSPPSSDIDPHSAVLRTPSPEGSPITVSIGDWSPVSSTTSPSGKRSTRLQAAGTEDTLVAEEIPVAFWDLLKGLDMYNRTMHDLMDEIWSLRQEWLEAKPGMFVRKVAYLLLGLSVNVDALQDIGGTSSAAYMQLCDVLAKDVLEESEGRLGKWEAFLRRLWYVC